MKLLAVSLSGDHDWNMSYFDGETVKHHKFERSKQVKRFSHGNCWEWILDVKNVFGVNVEDIDQFGVEFDAYEFYDVDNIPQEFVDIYEGKRLSFKLTDELNPFKPYGVNNVYFISHHYAHALSSWMLEEKEPKVRVVIDGLGDLRTWTVYKDNAIVDMGLQVMGSIGYGMRDAGKWLGLKSKIDHDLAGKVMGIQSYGCQDVGFLKYLDRFGIEYLTEIFSPQTYVEYTKDPSLARLQPLNWIKTVHDKVEVLIVDLFKKHADKDDIVSYSGGVAQNVVWNTALRENFKNIIIPPHAGDEGISFGVLEVLRRQNNLKKFTIKNFPYSQTDMAPDSDPSIDTIRLAAKFLSEGKIVGWYQGQGEVGPRALGNRSILMDPRIKDGKEKINKVKKRENYRPFGASVLIEHAKDYFKTGLVDDFMLFTDKPTSDVYPAITHVDGTCRVQTVRDLNPNFRLLLEEFYAITGCPILLNTSLNVANKPIAGYPQNAIEFFYASEIDVMVVGDNVLVKDDRYKVGYIDGKFRPWEFNT
jgi:carbamoyltransferase